MNPKVSVIIPVYKVEKYLSRCVDSIRYQTLEDIEIILINDGSPDSSPEICDDYRRNDKRVQVIHKTNGGLSEARNFGLQAASGEYVLFVDSDDWCENTMIEKLYRRAKEDASDVVICSYSIDYTNNNFRVKKELGTDVASDDIPEVIDRLDHLGMFNIVWNKLYRMDVLFANKISFELDGMPGEDLLFNCLVFKKIKSVSFENEMLYHYILTLSVGT